MSVPAKGAGFSLGPGWLRAESKRHSGGAGERHFDGDQEVWHQGFLQGLCPKAPSGLRAQEHPTQRAGSKPSSSTFWLWSWQSHPTVSGLSFLTYEMGISMLPAGTEPST